MRKEHPANFIKLPTRSVRIPAAQNKIFAVADAIDPCFIIDGEPDPFTVYFPISITNLYSATIYITALLLTPPAGWTDSEQNVTSLAVGFSGRVEKSNATRATGCQGTNESVTVRWRYRTESYSGPIVGFDDFTFDIYWETVASGTVDDTDSFENPPVKIGEQWYFDDWLCTKNGGASANTGWYQNATYYVHGAFSAMLRIGAQADWVLLEKQFGVGAGNRAGLFGFIRFDKAGAGIFTVTTPLETQTLIVPVANVWRRFGARLNPNQANSIDLKVQIPWAIGYPTSMYLDYIRVVRW